METVIVRDGRVDERRGHRSPATAIELTIVASALNGWRGPNRTDVTKTAMHVPARLQTDRYGTVSNADSAPGITGARDRKILVAIA
jgi:hypothetical protein